MTDEIDLTGILFIVFSILAFIVLIPPTIYHCINKNIPAISLMIWFAYINLVGIINAIIWSGNNYVNVTKAPGYCDLTVRITSGANLGLLCATTCLIFNLYMVISAKSYKFLNAESSTKKLVNVIMCWLNPVIVMGVSIIAQSGRYAIVKYRGCIAIYNYGIMSIVLSSLWNVLWVFAAVTFATLVIIEYIRKRRDLNDLLKCSNSGLNTRKFARLIIFSMIIIVVLSPVVLVGFYYDLVNASRYKDSVHINDPGWNNIFYINGGARSIVQRLIEIVLSFCAFFLFGLGTEALNMYRNIFTSIGLIKNKEVIDSPDLEFQGLRKHSSIKSITDETLGSENWFGPSACERYIISTTREDNLPINQSPTIQMVQGSERGSNFGLGRFGEVTSEHKSKRHSLSSSN